jgi:hypothetical protein
MAEVTSGKNLTVIVLEQHEADALAGMLHRWADDDTIEGDPRLWELYNALVPTEEDEPGRCACGYKLDGYAPGEDVCGACLDNPVPFYPVGGAA